VATKNIDKKISCFHCGEDCPDNSYVIDEKTFCCNGCKTVYEILDQSKLCAYYNFEQTPGISPNLFPKHKFDYLDEDEVIKKLVDFRDENIISVTFFIPQMHCSSCIWLLENLFRLNSAFTKSQVDFLKKKLSVSFNHNKISLKEVVILLSNIGYEPQIFLDSIEREKEKHTNRSLYFKIGIAGFCFGNIMLLSFPEYLSIDITEIFYRKLFGYLNLILSLPVFFYSASEYFISSIKGLKKKVVNIDFPISLGILALFLRSAYEIITFTGAGYSDSLTGLVFFLLIGKIFQQKTYNLLNFERSYKSYFPLAVTVKVDKEEKSIPVSNLLIGNRIIIRNNELIPADSILFNGEGFIDYSFVTGESRPQRKVSGELVYAGGRQLGKAIELEVIKEVSQSYLTRLWNNEAFTKKVTKNFTSISNIVGKNFTIAVLLIAAVSTALWLPVSRSTALNVFTAVLIVACPCAIALSIPFTLGHILRIFGRNKFYMKSIESVEELSKINSIVFDKTGTITKTGDASVKFKGRELNNFELEMIKSVVKNSTHPLSKIIYDSISANTNLEVENYSEQSGKGIEGEVLGNKIRIGSLIFVGDKSKSSIEFEQSESAINYDTKVYLAINDLTIGYFEIENVYRKGIEKLASGLDASYQLSVLSGDNPGEKENLRKIFSPRTDLLFNQSPEDKLEFIKKIQHEKNKVLMVGDGLNDAGALKQSNVGISVTEDISSFSPACDAILESSSLSKLGEFIDFSKTGVKIIYFSYAISFFYNLIGLSFAVSGKLTPLIAAVLMPLSSISVVAFATLTTTYFAKKRGLLSR
jgi:Cu+-exporting ATPase